MIDSHFHVNYLPQGCEEEMIATSRSVGVHSGVVAGVWNEDTQVNLQLAKPHLRDEESVKTSSTARYVLFQKSSYLTQKSSVADNKSLFGLFLAHGLHPVVIHSRWLDKDGKIKEKQMYDDMELFHTLLRENLDFIWALGETGFDASKEVKDSPLCSALTKKEILQIQQRAFDWCVELSLRYELPLIIHSRGAWEHTMNAIRTALDQGVKKVMIHCYGGPVNDLRKLADWNVYLSFGGVATWSRAVKVREAAKMCPAEIFMLETDSPDLAPERPDGKRPEVNFPFELSTICDSIARERGVDSSELARVSDENVSHFLGL